MSELEKALEALRAPLRFAARHDFAHLDRIKDLESTLQAAARRLVVAAAHSPHAEAAHALLASVPAIGLEPAPRVAALRQVLQLIDVLEGRVGGVALAPHKVASARQVAPDTSSGRAPRVTSGVPAESGGAGRRPPSARGVRTVSLRDLRADPESPRRPPAAPAFDEAPAPPDERPTSDLRERPRRPERPLEPSTELTFVKGVGPVLGELLAGRGLRTVEDLLRFLPRRYEDRRAVNHIGDLVVDTRVSVEGEVTSRHESYWGRRRRLEVIIADRSGALSLTWFRVPGAGFAERFTKGTRLRVSGQVKRYRGKLQIAHPETVFLDEDVSEVATDALVPVYLEIEGVRPTQVRRVLERALVACPRTEERLPEELRRRRALPPLPEALAALHRPPEGVSLDALHGMRTPWHRRLIYEELLLLQLAILQRRGRATLEPAVNIVSDTPLRSTAAALFEFPLTGAQQRVLDTLEGDLRRDRPMSRLLQGDVGSGKTAIAFGLAAFLASAGYQTAIMAPTELLAEQHARTALKVLTAKGLRVAFLSGSVRQSERRRIVSGLRAGEIHVVLGTHALIQEDIAFRALALGVVDEQHRFGVMQRSRLVELGRQSTGKAPHLLVMTATPIPRTLALTVYGDLEVCVLDELPPGRRPIATQLFRGRERAKAYRQVRRAVDEGRQAYVVFPLVEESDKEGMASVRDATSAAEELQSGPLQGVKVGLLHGRLPPDEKERVMRAFARGDTQVLVSTTVIEVGIDVANATVMVIEHAERFGLSQLHQLRGRVGRGAHASQCLMVAYATGSEEAWHRLQIMAHTNDGFRIAEEDLAIRGPGEFIGTKQAGLPLFQIANLARDQEILVEAREDALAVLNDDPSLERDDHVGLRALLREQWHGRLELARIG